MMRAPKELIGTLGGTLGYIVFISTWRPRGEKFYKISVVNKTQIRCKILIDCGLFNYILILDSSIFITGP
jgi:hypothetical protein